MTFEHMNFEEINAIVRDKDFDPTTDEWLNITYEVGKIANSLNERQQKEMRESFIVAAENKTINFNKSKEERLLCYERLQKKYPHAFIYGCSIDEFKEFYAEMLKQGRSKKEREEYIIVELMLRASKFNEVKILDRYIKKHPELDFMYFKNLHDLYYCDSPSPIT